MKTIALAFAGSGESGREIATTTAFSEELHAVGVRRDTKLRLKSTIKKRMIRTSSLDVYSKYCRRYGLPQVPLSGGPSGGSAPHAPQWPLYPTTRAQLTQVGVGLPTSP